MRVIGAGVTDTRYADDGMKRIGQRAVIRRAAPAHGRGLF
jgi:hypothetical protein